MPKLKGIPAYQPTMAVIAVILYLTLLPEPFSSDDLPLFPGADKIAHFMMFGGLTGTFIYDRWRTDRVLSLKGALLTALSSTSLGVLVEWLQYAMHLGRMGNDIFDTLANTAGAFLAVPICVALHWVNVTIDRSSR